MSFLPPQTKKPESSSSHYMKFADGDNKIRIVTDAITGWLYWVKGEGDTNKPVRVKAMPDEVPAEALPDKFGNYVKEFYAFGVWNYNEKKIQILEVTQTSIQEALFNLHSSEDWGDPKSYNITIIRGDKGGRVKYDVQPSPPSELSMEIANAVAEKPMNLAALFENGDPFQTDEHINIADIKI